MSLNNYYSITLEKYLNKNIDFYTDVNLHKDSDGNVSVIKWNLEDIQPTLEELQLFYNNNEEEIISESIQKPYEYYSWDSYAKNWIFDLELYKDYIVSKDMEIEFQKRLNSQYPLSDGFLVKPNWKELFASIEAGLKSNAQNPLGDIVGVDIFENKFRINNKTCYNIVNLGQRIRVKNSTVNNGYYTISDKYLDGTDTIIILNENIPSEVADGDICLDFCYLRSADKITYKLVTSENMNSVGAEMFNICNRIYESKYMYESNLRSQETKEGVDNILQAYINS